MALFQKKPGNNRLAGFEAELTATRRKHDDLVARRDRLAYQLAESEEARKAALLLDNDEESNAALAKAASACESYRSSLSGIDLLLAEHDARIVDLEAEIATGLDRQQREAKANALEEKSNTGQAAFDRFLEASDALAAALEGIGIFEADEVVIWARRLSHDFKNGRPRIFQSIDNRIAALRADPPPKPAPVQPPPPPLGEVSPYKRKFSTLSSPGAIGDRAPDHQYYYDGFAERT